ncbi:hypothetical protein [Yinghuangia seranimata]|uniref:hypothetical protein n=1 Tax=Yinghuangia seranimata TaxID=408067 RepID=UPI00248ACEA0|nr:hypothetical protein [Yinghuangia seranimata]MDI2129057.1 hypothetical protein [Yinghuangia seranimata]
MRIPKAVFPAALAAAAVLAGAAPAFAGTSDNAGIRQAVDEIHTGSGDSSTNFNMNMQPSSAQNDLVPVVVDDLLSG